MGARYSLRQHRLLNYNDIKLGCVVVTNARLRELALHTSSRLRMNLLISYRYYMSGLSDLPLTQLNSVVDSIPAFYI